jgi:hypothetical protein
LHNDEADESLKALDEIKENDDNEGDHFFDVNAPPVEDLGDDSTGAGIFDRSTCSKRSKESLLQTFFPPFAQILEYFIIL